MYISTYPGISIVDPLTTLYAQNRVRLYSQAADPMIVNFTFRQAIICDAAADHDLGFALKFFLLFHELIPESIDCLSYQV